MKKSKIMKKYPLLLICLISALAAIVVVVVLKFLGHDNPTVIGGGVAGGIAGAISPSLLKRKKK
jgi:preprotein translocase subunit SecG